MNNIAVGLSLSVISFGLSFLYFGTFNSEDELLTVAYITFWTTLIYVVIKSKNKIMTISLNLIAHIIYSGVLLYAIYYEYYGYGSFIVIIMLLSCLAIHLLINLAQLWYIDKNKK